MNVETCPVYANTEEVHTVSTDAAGEIFDATTFRFPNGIDRIWLVTGRSHFDDDLGVVIECDEIKFSVGDLKVGADHVEAMVYQEPDSQPLAKLPKFPTMVDKWSAH